MSLDGKVALVTGSTSGIGLAVAKELAKQKCNIMLNGFGDAAEIEALRASLETEYGVKVLFNGANLAVSSEIAALIADVTTRLGRIDILINNAGTQFVSPVAEFPDDKWDQIIAVNLTACFHTIKHSVPHMRTNGFGRIINIASVHGLVGSANKCAYVASKHGLVGMTKVIALETAEDPITCNTVCPGWVRTPLVEKQIEARAAELGVSLAEGARGLLSEKQPSKEFVQPEQLGQLVLFLCSDAASQMTGTALPMDGGWTAV
mmetsp:Transcript_14300/g.33409  ORF Transcript_14300/g.33409 Transcript_14300/m.33409 type:complete len:262 (-) Transcript_14300:133-918(-)